MALLETMCSDVYSVLPRIEGCWGGDSVLPEQGSSAASSLDILFCRSRFAMAGVSLLQNPHNPTCTSWTSALASHALVGSQPLHP